jgi:hypothetical protein
MNFTAKYDLIHSERKITAPLLQSLNNVIAQVLALRSNEVLCRTEDAFTFASSTGMTVT